MKQKGESPPSSAPLPTGNATITATPIELREAFFTFHLYHAPLLFLDSAQGKTLQQAKDIISTAGVDVLSTTFPLEDNEKFRGTFSKLGNSGSIFCCLRVSLFDNKKSIMVLPIHLAALLGNMGLVDLCLQRGRHLECKKMIDSFGRTPLVYAILGGSIDVVKLLIKAYPDDVSREIGQYRLLPIHFTAYYGSLDIIQLLLEISPDTLSRKDINGDLPLHYAVKFGHALAVKLLADKQLAKFEGSSRQLPLSMAAERGDIDTVRFLHDLYPEASYVKLGGDLPIHIAVEYNQFEVIQFLITKYPTMVKMEGSDGKLPLHYAAEYGNLEVFKYLYDKFPGGAFRQDGNGQRPIHIAIKSEQEEIQIVHFLLEKDPEQIKVKNSDGDLPLHLAANSIRLDILKYVYIKYPEAASIKGENDNAPMHNAVSAGCIDNIKFLHKVNPSMALYRNEEWDLPIDFNFGNQDVVKVCLDLSLSCSIMGPLFAKELFSKQPNDALEHTTPPWERRDSSWSKIIDKYGPGILVEVQALKTHPIAVFASFGSFVPVAEVEFMIGLLQLNLAELVDDQGQDLLTIIIKEASRGREEHWEPYFRPLLEMVNSKLHELNADGNHLLAKGDGAVHNILHNAALNGLPWYGLRLICEVNVDSLIIPHGESGLYPFMLPCVMEEFTTINDECRLQLSRDNEEPLSKINSIHQILLMRPDVIKIAYKDDGDDHNMERSAKRSRKSYL